MKLKKCDSVRQNAPQRSRKCLTDVINSHLAHMRIEFSCNRIDDLKSHKRRKSEVLQTNADLGGALSDHADVRRGGNDFADTARALFGSVDGVQKRQPSDRRQWISVQLKEGGRVRQEIKITQRLTKRRVSFGNWPSSAGNHLSWLLWT